MPSFDVVSEIDQHELVNAIDQANREINNRFDFKGTNSKVELSEQTLLVISKSEFQVKQINDILKNKINKRGIDKEQAIDESGVAAGDIDRARSGHDSALRENAFGVVPGIQLGGVVGTDDKEQGAVCVRLVQHFQLFRCWIIVTQSHIDS